MDYEDMITEDGEGTESEMFFGLPAERWKATVAAEQRSSIGFMQNGTIEGDRETALKAIKGDVGIPNMENRSGVNDTAIAEAIDTLMPDLMEIFTGGDDVAAFQPVGNEDVDLAMQETQAVVHIVMEQNDGFNLIHDYCQDALSLKTGIFKVTWEEEEEVTTSVIPDATPEMADTIAAQGIEVQVNEDTGRIEMVKRTEHGYACVEVVAPEDFGVAPDTIELKDAVYCVMRSKVRMQSLVKKGFDRAKLGKLQHGDFADDAVEDARDTVENDEDSTTHATIDGLKQVEVHEHYLRFDPEGGDDIRIFQVVTDSLAGVLLSVEEVDVIPFAAGTPYRRAHRFYGLSIADKLLEIQKIKTVLHRMMLDNGYFGVNNRLEINVNQITPDTYSDLANNAPGKNVRTKGNALAPIETRGLDFDTISALEAYSVVGEQRSGVVRNAQGLNPDTLHDTAKGAQILISAAQKRTRFIARVLAQGIKDMYLLVHRLTRTNGSPTSMRLAGNEFQEVDPSEWNFRKDARIEIAVGSGGRDEKLAMLMQVVERQIKGVELQGGVSGPLVNAEGLHNSLEDLTKTAGLPQGRYFMDPAEYEAPEPKPDPDTLKLQQEGQLAQAKMQQEGQLKQMEMQQRREAGQLDLQLKREEAAARIQAMREDAALKAQLERQKAEAENDRAERKFAAELELERMKIELGAAQAADAELSKQREGGDLDK